MDERHIRNLGPISARDQKLLSAKTVLIAGLGGLGGYLLEHMVRAGTGTVIAVDGDVFGPSNLNRQLLCTEETIGRKKAEVAAQRAAAIDPAVRLIPVSEMITEDNCFDLLHGCDLVLDGLDHVQVRRILAKGCAQRGIPMIHGAIGDWYAQVCVIPPGSGLLDRIYPSDGGSPEPSGCLSPLPALCASIQAAQAICLLCGRPAPLWGKLLLTDLLHTEQALLPLLSSDEGQTSNP